VKEQVIAPFPSNEAETSIRNQSLDLSLWHFRLRENSNLNTDPIEWPPVELSIGLNERKQIAARPRHVSP
jgi:hypothetical protein